MEQLSFFLFSLRSFIVKSLSFTQPLIQLLTLSLSHFLSVSVHTPTSSFFHLQSDTTSSNEVLTFELSETESFLAPIMSCEAGGHIRRWARELTSASPSVVSSTCQTSCFSCLSSDSGRAQRQFQARLYSCT